MATELEEYARLKEFQLTSVNWSSKTSAEIATQNANLLHEFVDNMNDAKSNLKKEIRVRTVQIAFLLYQANLHLLKQLTQVNRVNITTPDNINIEAIIEEKLCSAMAPMLAKLQKLEQLQVDKQVNQGELGNV